MSGNDVAIQKLIDAQNKTMTERDHAMETLHSYDEHLKYHEHLKKTKRDSAMEILHDHNEALKAAHDKFAITAPTSSGAFFNHTANRLTGPVVAQIRHLHGNQFWSDIQITADDYVRFKLFRGGWISKALFLLGKEPKDEDGKKQEWDSIGHQGTDAKLEVTLGRTYLKIDEIIADELGDHKHRKFIKEIAKTDPDNLKMIASLKNLDEGMKEGSPEVPELNDTARPATVWKYKPSISVTGSGTITGNNLSLSSNVTEIVKVDSDGNLLPEDRVMSDEWM